MRNLLISNKERPVANTVKWVALGFTAAMVLLLSHHEVFHQEDARPDFSEVAANGAAVDV